MRYTQPIFLRIYAIFPGCVLLATGKILLPWGDGFPTTHDYQNIFCGFVSQLYWTCLSGIRMPDDVQSEHKIVEINRWWERDGLDGLKVDASALWEIVAILGVAVRTLSLAANPVSEFSR